jgi:hypothetical protein
MEGSEQEMKVCLMDIGEIVYEVEEMMKNWKVQGKKWKYIRSIMGRLYLNWRRR